MWISALFKRVFGKLKRSPSELKREARIQATRLQTSDPEGNEQTTIRLRRRTPSGRVATGGIPVAEAVDGVYEEMIEIDYDKDLEQQQTVCDEKAQRLAHEAHNRSRVRKEMHEVLDTVIEFANKKQSAG